MALPRNQGKPWAVEGIKKVISGWHHGFSIPFLAEEAGRSAVSIEYVLKNHLGADYQKQFNSHSKGTTMSEQTQRAAIETRTFIYGVDAADVTDAQIDQHIARLEAVIAKSETIKNRTKALDRAMATAQMRIDQLVEFSNSRQRD